MVIWKSYRERQLKYVTLDGQSTILKKNYVQLFVEHPST